MAFRRLSGPWYVLAMMMWIISVGALLLSLHTNDARDVVLAFKTFGISLLFFFIARSLGRIQRLRREAHQERTGAP